MYCNQNIDDTSFHFLSIAEFWYHIDQGIVWLEVRPIYYYECADSP